MEKRRATGKMLDIHTHILPGLDDGAPDLETALDMARIAVADGITAVAATPHFLEGSMENHRELIRQRVIEFQQALDKAGIPLQVLPGAEVYISPETPELLQKGQLMTINDRGRHLLIEFPLQSIPSFAEEVIFKIMVQGITPIIAHPERNVELSKQPERMLALAAKGCLLQINSGSLTGSYGQQVRKTAQLLVQSDLVHLIGSDAHSAGGRSPRLREALGVAGRIKKGKPEEIQGCAKQVLAGESVTPDVPVEMKELERGLWGRTKRVFYNRNNYG
jgi:protein-tyrosine phosphatase